MEPSLSTPNRLANGGLGAVPAVAALVYATQAGGTLSRLVATAAAIAFAVLAVRGYRLDVTYAHTRMVVRGYLRTRTVDRARVTDITDFPAVRWTAHNGRSRWTPLTALMTSPGGTSATRLRKERALVRLRQWPRRDKAT
ncbi:MULTISPECIES: hypothetical protein [unclassified Streptomyces]|uniref:hypothetical protein n=1 Tax=unclassified Streptomyces TaxID=2593676 RepID=UPI003827BD3B